ncbi:septal ring lytic transglycosylase RlpA family protein [Almyronema epifaneia]|uniref:Probable endolytic peptidoglycan transglycosylase RlpA n=1 Tax=Almyronema epifaneia S1 TaxID=2991925 RepID=A0ABW6IJ50_9CYAN
MKQKFLGSLTAALVVSAIGPALSVHAQQTDDLGQSLSDNAVYASSPVTDETQSVNQAELAANASTQNQDFIRVLGHPLDTRQAATLYIHNIPVLTFLGATLDTTADKAVTAGSRSSANDVNEPSEVPASGSDQAFRDDPVIRATAVAARINQLTRNQLDASRITAHWDAAENAYVIKIDGNPLVSFDENLILPDTTSNPAEDTLQATNRLRRLLGAASPLTEIEGQPQPTPPQVANVAFAASGMASWYGPGFHGRRSASGEVFNQNALTAAHRTLPFGTQVRVTNLSNNQQVVVRINDRGPYSHGRIIDLSAAAARQIGLAQAGVGRVRIEVLQ